MTKFISLTQFEEDRPIHAVSVNPQQIAHMEPGNLDGTFVYMSSGKVLAVVQERDEIIKAIENMNVVEARP